MPIRFPYKFFMASLSFTTCLSIQPSHAATQLANVQNIEQTTTDYQAINGLTVRKTLTASQPYFYLYAKGTTTSDTATGIMMFGLQILCSQEVPAGKTPLVGAYQTTRNHEGSNAYGDGKLQLQVRYLFKAPAAGTYNCSVLAKNLIGTGGEKHVLTLQPGSDTYLATDSAVTGAGSWGNENDKSDFLLAGSPADAESHKCVRSVKDDKDVTVEKPIDPPYSGDQVNVTNYCKGSVHVGPDLPAGKSVYALRSDHWTATGLKIKGMGDIEVTSCYNGTGSCPPYAWGAQSDKASGSVVKTRLVVEQYAAGATSSCARANSPYQTTEISSNAHHLKIYHDLADIAVDSCATGGYVVSKVQVDWVKGNPVRIEDSRYSQNMLMNQ